MRHGVIAVAVISLCIGICAPSSYGETAYGVGDFMGFDAFSGVGILDTTTSQATMVVHTPGLRWYGATDGLTPDTFFAVANPTYAPTPQSQLYLIDTNDWSVTPVGAILAPPGGGPIREIGLDENSGTLYGTDYLNLYTVPTTAGGGTAGNVGSFSPFGTPLDDAIDYVFSMDYDHVSDQLFGASWDRTANQTNLYSFTTTSTPATGQAVLIGPTGVDRTSDMWFANGSETMMGTARDGRILNINTATGAATVVGIADEVNFYGLANATPATPAPLPYMTAPLSNLGYETAVFADATSHVEAPGLGSSTVPDQKEDHGLNGPAQVDFEVLATLQGPAGSPWQKTDVGVDIDLSNSPSIPGGMLRVSSKMTVDVTGSDEGLLGVTRNSSVHGYGPPILASGYIHGAIGVAPPVGGVPGDPVLLGVGVYDWGSGIDLLTWNLIIKDDADGTPYLTANETSDLWAFTFMVPAGRVLDYEFSYYGAIANATDGSYDLFVDLDFGGATQAPEPASMIALSIGAFSLVARKRRRRT